MEVHEALLNAIRSTLRGDESREELVQLLTASGIPDETVDALVEQLQPQAVPPAPPDAGSAKPAAPAGEQPRLLVDWGVEPQIGHQMRPQFLLVCPRDYPGRPRVVLEIDPHLDCDDHVVVGPLMSENEGLWSLHPLFGLTTQGESCRPGQYLLRYKVGFERVGDANLPRFFHCTVRLRVEESGAKRTLEIDGDGQSIVNLHGQDLSSFSRVVLKAGDAGIVNVQSMTGSDSNTSAPPSEPENVAHEYALKVDFEQQRWIPQTAVPSRRQQIDRLTVVCASGRRTVLLPKRRATVGRSRSNDIVLRFLPRNELHDRLSRNISRTHLTVALQDDGLCVEDCSKTGTSLDFDPLDESRALSLEEGDEPLELELGITQRLTDDPFTASLQLFGRPEDEPVGLPIAERDRIYCSVLGERVPRPWKTSQQSGIDAARFCRVNNLANQEDYVLLFREALIGRSGQRCPIVLANPAAPPVAARLFYVGRCFWFESLDQAADVRVDGRPLLLRTILPIVEGISVEIAGSPLCFEFAGQLHL